MPGKKENTSKRKKEHIEICLRKDVSFRSKTNGLERYEFEHYAITEVEIDKIDFSTRFFNKTISYPFLISCMTGGTYEAVNLNKQLALATRELNIPIGAGSQRQAVEDNEFLKSFKILREEAGNVPILGNIGAAQIASAKDPAGLVKELIDMLEADAFVIHLNPAQELFQKEGNTNFKGLLNAVEKICSSISIPIIAKEVGAGISANAAVKLLQVGVKGIDVAGAGGTSWTAVEMIRNKNNQDFFRDWGLPTSYCINEVKKLKNDFSFCLIASGGINSGIETAKTLALGADITASARIILNEAAKKGAEGVVNLLKNWFNEVRKIMYLTGAQDLESLSKIKMIMKEELF